MTFKMKNEDQTITIYNLRADTNEFIGGGDTYIPANTGLPAYCTDIEPPATNNGEVAVFDSAKNKWAVIEDNRDSTVYDVNSGLGVYITELGPVPNNTTPIQPNGPYQKWDSKEWVKDEEAENAAKLVDAQSQKNNLMQVANDHITPLQYAVDLDMATDEEKQQLLNWKKYCVQLSRADVSNPELIVWPTPPAI